MKPMGLRWRNVNEKDDREDVFPASAIEEEQHNSAWYSGRTEEVDLVYHIIPRT